MVSIYAAKDETRSRDKRRGRLVLQIGTEIFHITRREAKALRGQLARFNLDDQKGER